MNIDEKATSTFWSRVAKGGPDECWVWQAGRVPYGYGAFYVRPRNYGTHVISWWIANKHKRIPNGYQVCHRCDNPPCVNPAHLFLGSVADNFHDSVKKGRRRHVRLPPANEHADKMPRGSQHWNARLTEDVVREIRTRLADGQRQCEVMRAMSLPRRTVQEISSGRKWRHVTI